MEKTEYWLLNSEELKAYREWVQKRLELAEKIAKKYDQLLWDVNSQLNQTEMNEYRTQQWLKEQSDKIWDDEEDTTR